MSRQDNMAGAEAELKKLFTDSPITNEKIYPEETNEEQTVPVIPDISREERQYHAQNAALAELYTASSRIINLINHIGVRMSTELLTAHSSLTNCVENIEVHVRKMGLKD